MWVCGGARRIATTSLLFAAVACTARAPLAVTPPRRSAAAPAQTATSAKRRKPAPGPVPTGSAPAIDIHAEPWRDPKNEPAAVERIPDEPDPDEPLNRVSVLDHWPTRFRRKPPPRGFGLGLALLSRTVFEVRSRRWREELRNRCTGGFTSSMALVTDQAGRVRALSWSGGSDDSAGTDSLFYDDQGRLRFVFMSYANVTNTVSEHLLAFDQHGKVVACDLLVLKRGEFVLDICPRPEPEDEPELDPDVRRVIRPEALPKPEPSVDTMLEHYLAVDPRADFAKCLAPAPAKRK